MFSNDDVTLCILHSCDVKADRLVYYIYLYQKAGLGYSFQYKTNVSGLYCRGLTEAIDALVNDDKVEYRDGLLCLTKSGSLYYDDIILTYHEWYKLNTILDMLNDLSEADLFLICMADLMISEVRSKSGVAGLISQESRIKVALSHLASSYSEENFDAALKFIKTIKEV